MEIQFKLVMISHHTLCDARSSKRSSNSLNDHRYMVFVHHRNLSLFPVVLAFYFTHHKWEHADENASQICKNRARLPPKHDFIP